MNINPKEIISEKEMVETYLRNLKKEKGDKIIAFKEVKNYQKSIDIVETPIIKRGLGVAHAVECKVFNWRGAFKQALGNRVYIPYNSIAIWSDYKNKIKEEDLINEGIGLIFVSLDQNVVKIKPKKSQFLIKSTYKKIRENIKKKIE